MRGKQWTVEEEKRLRQMLEAGKSVRAIAKTLGKTRDCIRMKIARLGLEVVVHAKSTDSRTTTTTSSLILPAELISAEDALKLLVGALKMACTPGLDKVEVQRLQTVATLARTYSEKLTEYLDLRGLEQRLFELEGKYAGLAKKTRVEKTKGNRSSR